MSNISGTYTTQIKIGIEKLSRILEQEHLDRARHLARSGNYSEAESEINSFCFSDPGMYITSLLLLAKIYAQQGLSEKAAQCWKAVQSKNPENSEVIHGLSDIAALSATKPSWPWVRIVFIWVIILTVISLFYWSILDNFKTIRQEIAFSHKNLLSSAEKRLRDVSESNRKLQSELNHNIIISNKEYSSSLTNLIQDTTAKFGQTDNTLTELEIKVDEGLQYLRNQLTGFEEVVGNGFKDNMELLQAQIEKLVQDTSKQFSQIGASHSELEIKFDKGMYSLMDKLSEIDQQVKSNQSSNSKQINDIQDRVTKVNHQIALLIKSIHQLRKDVDSLGRPIATQK